MKKIKIEFLLILILTLLLTSCLVIMQQEVMSQYYNLSNFNFLNDNFSFDRLLNDKILFIGTFSMPNFEYLSASFNKCTKNNLSNRYPTLFQYYEDFNDDLSDSLSILITNLKYSIFNDFDKEIKNVNEIYNVTNVRYLCYSQFQYFGITSSENMTMFTNTFGNLPVQYDNKSIVITFKIWDSFKKELLFDKEISYLATDQNQGTEPFFKKSIHNFMNSILMLKYDRKTQLVFNSICNDYHDVSILDAAYLIKQLGGYTIKKRIDLVIHFNDKKVFLPAENEFLDKESKLKLKRLLLDSNNYFKDI